MPLKLKYLLALCLFVCSLSLKADHYLGASISYKSLGGFSYEYTVITYTATDHPQSDKDLLTLFCGDGKTVVLSRSNGTGTFVNADILKSIYKGQYTYSKEGNYQVYISEPFRHTGILNINEGKSAIKKLFISSVLPVYSDPSVCVNNGAEYQMDPLFYACQGVEYTTAFGLFDPDGDSLSYEITDCKGVNGLTVEGYFVPSSVTIDPLTGIFKWSNPVKGSYAFSVTVNEFRKSKKIGVSNIDFLVEVSTEFTTAPSFSIDPQFTVNANGSYEKTITPSDELEYGSSISLVGTHTISYSTWNNTGATVSNHPLITASSVSDTITWTTLPADGRTAPYVFVHRFSITEGGKFLQKDFAVLVRVDGDQVITCTVPDISTTEDVPPELFDYTLAPTLFTDGVYLNTGSSPDQISVFIYDIQGKEIEAFSNFTQQTVFLDLSHLAAATYIVVLWKDTTKIVTRIVKL
ncbi:MAG: T9SS type A sorting domain-containing protein [Flavobacteriales bacterium]